MRRRGSWSVSLGAMNEAICLAIRERRLIRFPYGGGERLVEPHCHGTSAAGQEMLLAYQREGHSSSGEREGWKMFAVARMGPIVDGGQQFAGPRPRFDPTRTLTHVHCSVSVLRLVP
jgi:hypothetical protein